ncbi:TrkH family potassium uptake protein [Finegoldia magna]|uniref:TrkH family potassium uptake protein n=2 Tax=Finegoldia TaxID=150022 RepID=A0ABW9KBC3_9FIRM|nr:TrkH family potassium uptake protein [Finegoldia magna]MCC2717008.1 TrkH family potassium uptake protein [Finegoldia magna]MDU2499480.1 TrkH family potassium uptake protein [Finegoldia magna]MDU3805678.1 TrkH family potassium uptake protein [Finegoldia magna]MDU4334810.1 TrkH family potassium uptake protein [Finegoldia magna]OXZ28544.1 Trk family potassium uptake protein [Finegoldia magna]
MKRLKKYLEDNPPLVLILSFLFLIVVGSLLLSLPISQNATKVPYIDCLFTATSSVCVTGLVTVATYSTWSFFGKLIIIILIQMGGLGFMTFATLIALVMGRRITLKDRLIIKEQTNSIDMQGMVKLIRYILISTFTIETIGAFLLMTKFVPMYGFKGIFYSFFHSISAFCNAGFDILGPNSLIDINTNFFILLVIGLLIVIGGIGFNVILDILHNGFDFKKFSLHSKIVLTTTVLMLSITSVLIFAMEFLNPETIGNLSLTDKISNSVFQAVTLRTAGFSAIDQSKLLDSSSVLSILNMFIGGSPAGTAGGIKTTTFALLIIVALSEIKGQEDVEVFNRRIRFSQVKKALAIITLSMVWVIFVTFAILVIDKAKYLDVVYEVVSAFGTVGLTRSLTPTLNIISKILIISTMYIGRVGSLTILFALSNTKNKKAYKEAHENIIIG